MRCAHSRAGSLSRPSIDTHAHGASSSASQPASNDVFPKPAGALKSVIGVDEARAMRRCRRSLRR
jgi:hypothetical protein